jgi:CheY-like chemotaxis protein
VSQPAKESALNRPKILIVEDDADTRKALNLRLRFNDFDTVYAVDGFSAVSAAAREHPDVILLDIGLPAGDGFMVMERLKANEALAAIPVIILTGRERKGNFQRAMQAGCFAYFEKPADNDALLTAIRNAAGMAAPVSSQT